MDNPHEQDGLWYWFDETGIDSLPYQSEHLSALDLLMYNHVELDGGFYGVNGGNQRKHEMRELRKSIQVQV